VRVDAQGELRVGVPELVHDVPRVAAKGDEDRGKGVPEPVGRHAAWKRVLAAVREQPVGALEHGPEHALVDVRLWGAPFHASISFPREFTAFVDEDVSWDNSPRLIDTGANWRVYAFPWKVKGAKHPRYQGLEHFACGRRCPHDLIASLRS
jgi:hypothetical protein